ncbi:MAG: 1-deoxy-D-xylulose-5-phosphate reductoisomerase [Prevotellaceae bacterium]|jgi:1-deoxy-D-xylulose-5-phosphate reductoisomerase|nr:1-deoxy-D-xylulose-5-phosphate reductoisomerase [Prevotellaceae bacterium]
MKRIAILGSTGSIGIQALEVVRSHPEQLEVICLTANSNAELLMEQAKTFNPDCVVIADEEKYTIVRDALAQYPIKVYAGSDALAQVVEQSNIDMVLAAIVGYAGLPSTFNALKSGKAVALANKETLVVAGDLIIKTARENNAPIIPVDSEHSAIFQCLVGEYGPVEKIYLTASGGPFLNHTQNQLRLVTKDDALKHPSWVMGEKITIDCASMMNKGFEVIEAKWLFDLKPEQIEVLVHPQSIVHSMVQLKDGSIKAQLGRTDMKLPIRYAFSFPERWESGDKRLSFDDMRLLEFRQPDTEKFPCLALAYEAMNKGGNVPCILNAANEIAVEAFLNNRLVFTMLPKVLAATMEKHHFIANPTFDDYLNTNKEARRIATEIIRAMA